MKHNLAFFALTILTAQQTLASDNPDDQHSIPRPGNAQAAPEFSNDDEQLAQYGKSPHVDLTTTSQKIGPEHQFDD